MTDLDRIQRARALLINHATHSDEARRIAAMSGRDVFRRFVIWCWELGDYSLCACLKILFNNGYRGPELDLTWVPK